jgi:uncharacterized membrane protein YheB (UPF0754 family)
MEKTYTFTKSSAAQQALVKYTKKESELNQEEKDLLLGELLKTWDNTPDEVTHRFTQMLIKDMTKQIDETIKERDTQKERLLTQVLKTSERDTPRSSDSA